MKTVALKILATFGVLVVAALVNVFLKESGIVLGGLLYALLFGLILLLPITIIWKWKPKEKPTKQKKPLRLLRDAPPHEQEKPRAEPAHEIQLKISTENTERLFIKGMAVFCFFILVFSIVMTVCDVVSH